MNRQAPPGTSSIRMWLALGVFLVGAMAMIGVAAEGVLRLTRDPRRFYPYHPNAVYVFYPSEDLTPGVAGPSYFTTNSFGCRGPEPDGERHRLLVIGGSTAACTALDDPHAWPQLVMQMVNEHLHDPTFLWVTNSAIDGNNTRHHLMQAQFLVPAIPHLDHVLVYAGLNDIGSWLFSATFDPNYLDKPENVRTTIAESFRVSNYTYAGAPWYEHLELWKRASILKAAYLSHRHAAERASGRIVEDDRMAWIASARALRQRAEKSLVPRAKLGTFEVALDSYGRNLERIVELVRHAGAEPIFMAQAAHYRGLTPEEKAHLWMGALDGGSSYVDEEEMQRFVDAYNARMASVAAKAGVPFIDLPDALPNEPGIFYDDCHFTDKGAQVVAKVVTDFLVTRVYDDRSDGQGGSPSAP